MKESLKIFHSANVGTAAHNKNPTHKKNKNNKQIRHVRLSCVISRCNIFLTSTSNLPKTLSAKKKWTIVSFLWHTERASWGWTLLCRHYCTRRDWRESAWWLRWVWAEWGLVGSISEEWVAFHHLLLSHRDSDDVRASLVDIACDRFCTPGGVRGTLCRFFIGSHFLCCFTTLLIATDLSLLIGKLFFDGTC